MKVLTIYQRGTPENGVLFLKTEADQKVGPVFKIQRETSGGHVLECSDDKWTGLDSVGINEKLASLGYSICETQKLASYLEAIDPESNVVAVMNSSPVVALFSGGPVDGLKLDSEKPNPEQDFMGIDFLRMDSQIGKRVKFASPKQRMDFQKVKTDANGKMDHVPSSLNRPFLTYEVIERDVQNGKIFVVMGHVPTEESQNA